MNNAHLVFTRYSRAAFSLPELLVSIGIIALLLTLALPSLASSRMRARSLQSSLNTRTLGQLIFTYCDDFREAFPVPILDQLYPANDESFRIAYPYWQVTRTWTGPMYYYLPYDKHHATYLSPGAKSSRDILGDWPTSYHLSTTVAADPALWSAVQPSNPDSFVRHGRVADLRFPSKKGLLWDSELAYIRTRRFVQYDLATDSPMMMGDQSVSLRKPSDAVEPVVNLLNSSGSGELRVHNTPMGLAGVDYN